MEILGIGLPEALFILIIALLILGPNDMAKAGKSVGEFIGRFMQSETWQAIQRMWAEIRNLPNTLAEQSGANEIRETLTASETIEDVKKELGRPGLDAWTSAPNLSDGKNTAPDKSSGTPRSEQEQS